MIRNKYVSGELDLIEIFKIIWKKKLKISIITAIFLIVGIIYSVNQKKAFIAKTNIVPISAFEEFYYKKYNLYLDKINSENFLKDEDYSINQIDKKPNNIDFKKNTYSSFVKIDKLYLQSLFVDSFKNSNLIEDAIIKFSLIDKENYENDEAYKAGVKRLASSIKLFPPIKNKKDEEITFNWTINFKIQDKKKWEQILNYTENALNKNIQINLINMFSQLIENERQLKKYQIEDLNQKISNAKDSYKNDIKIRLAFLEEQAKIARALDITKNNLIESQSFNTDTGIVTNIKTEIPYYMRGYMMIEEEIRLIKNRTNEENFIKDLSFLEKEKKDLIFNKDIERIENLINQTPIINSDNFVAAKINYLSTIYINNDLQNKVVILIITFIGMIVGILFAMIETVFKKQKKIKKES